MKLIKKTRVGSKLKRCYDKPQTPLERMLQCPRPIRSKSNSLYGYAIKPIPLSWPNASSKSLSVSLRWPTSGSAHNRNSPLAHPRLAVKNRLSARSPRYLQPNSRNDPDGLDRMSSKGRCHCVDPGAVVEGKFHHPSPDFQKARDENPKQQRLLCSHQRMDKTKINREKLPTAGLHSIIRKNA